MTKVGFIGAGDISLLHAEGLKETREAELLGIWNRTRSRAEEKAAFDKNKPEMEEVRRRAVKTSINPPYELRWGVYNEYYNIIKVY